MKTARLNGIANRTQCFGIPERDSTAKLNQSSVCTSTLDQRIDQQACQAFSILSGCPAAVEDKLLPGAQRSYSPKQVGRSVGSQAGFERAFFADPRDDGPAFFMTMSLAILPGSFRIRVRPAHAVKSPSNLPNPRIHYRLRRHPSPKCCFAARSVFHLANLAGGSQLPVSMADQSNHQLRAIGEVQIHGLARQACGLGDGLHAHGCSLSAPDKTERRVENSLDT
jgi:hypothetical protein